MAAYPSIGFKYTLQEMNGVRQDIAGEGSIRGVSLGEKIVYRIVVDHPTVSAADRATLIAFYETNRTSANTIVIQGETFDFHFQAITKDHSKNGSYFDVAFRAVGNKQ